MLAFSFFFLCCFNVHMQLQFCHTRPVFMEGLGKKEVMLYVILRVNWQSIGWCYFLCKLRSALCFRYCGGLAIMFMRIAGTCLMPWLSPSPAAWIKMSYQTWTRSWSSEFMQLPAQQTSNQSTLKILIFSDQQAMWMRMWTRAAQKLMKGRCLATGKM